MPESQLSTSPPPGVRREFLQAARPTPSRRDPSARRAAPEVLPLCVMTSRRSRARPAGRGHAWPGVDKAGGA